MKMKIRFKKEEVNGKWMTEWVDNLNKKLDTHIYIENNEIFFPPEIAEGTCSYHLLAEGLDAFVMNITFKKSLIFERIPTKQSSFYSLHLNCSVYPVEHVSNGQKNRLGGSVVSGLFWASSDTSASFKVHEDKKVEAVIISMSKEYLQNAFWDAKSPSHACILKDNDTNACILRSNGTHKCVLKENSASMCVLNDNEHLISNSLYTQIGRAKYHLAQEMIHYNKQSAIPEKFVFKANILKILALFIKRITSDNKETEKTFQFNDASKIMEIKKLVEENADFNHFTLDELSKIAGMSKTKLKIKFKEIVGVSVYQHYLEVRMQKAKELLYSNPGSITNIAYGMGFKTVSHFSQLFKKHYGVNPKEMLIASKKDAIRR